MEEYFITPLFHVFASQLRNKGGSERFKSLLNAISFVM